MWELVKRKKRTEKKNLDIVIKINKNETKAAAAADLCAARKKKITFFFLPAKKVVVPRFFTREFLLHYIIYTQFTLDYYSLRIYFLFFFFKYIFFRDFGITPTFKKWP